jgi:hypothetical protein
MDPSEGTPDQLNNARQDDADASFPAKTASRLPAGTAQDIARLRNSQIGKRPGDPLWNRYVDYFHRRYQQLVQQQAAGNITSPGPLGWPSYSDLQGPLARGTAFQASFTQQLGRDRSNDIVQSNVGMTKGGDKQPRYVDQLVVDKTALASWAPNQPRGPPPKIESYSDKSRVPEDYSSLAAFLGQVARDATDACKYYGGKVNIRRKNWCGPAAGNPSLFDQTLAVSNLFLIYDQKTLTSKSSTPLGLPLQDLERQMTDKATSALGCAAPAPVPVSCTCPVPAGGLPDEATAFRVDFK